MDLLVDYAEEDTLAVRALGSQLAAGHGGELPSGGKADAGAAISGGGHLQGLGGCRGGCCGRCGAGWGGGGGIDGGGMPCFVELPHHRGLGFGEACCVVIEHGGGGFATLGQRDD